MILLLVLIIGSTTGFDLKCPVQAEWRLRANVYCSSAAEYVCLFHLLDKKYQDVCLWSDRSSIGSKLVFQPHFNIAECKAASYQPIVFSTQGNSECILQTSKCAEDGQVVYSNGSSSNDTVCRCDYTKGYTFVQQPNKSCFCIPSQEDCSCFRSACKKLSPDYRCITDGQIITKTKCLEIYQPHISFSIPTRVVPFIKSNRKSYVDTHLVGSVTISIFAVCLVITVLVVVMICDLDADEEKNGNETTDEKRQKFIHELFLKGELGKPHFARLVFIGKNGVGKTSLMRRLLWQNKEDVTSTQSTDGLEIDKCHINILDGKWTKYNKIGDDLNRFIRQVFPANNMIGPDIGESSNVSDINSIDDANIFNKDSDKKSSESVSAQDIDISRTSSNASILENIDNNETGQTDQILAENNILQTVHDNNINSKESEYEHVTDENINQSSSTIMQSYLKRSGKEPDGTLAFCTLWDFAGQKDFYATHQVFLSNCTVYLLVTDSLEFSTAAEQWIDFEDSASYVSFWFDTIHCYSSTTKEDRLDPPIIVVCTNQDKFKDLLERQKQRKQFQEYLGKVLKNQEKKRHLRNVYFVSNIEDNDEVFEEIRNDISKQAMDMKNWGTVCPLKWLLFQQVLGSLSESGVPISSTMKLSKIAKHDDIGITDDEQFKLCLQYCHENGTVVYFEEENLQDYVILDPKWLVDVFRCLVSDKIETEIKYSDDWQNMIETGELTDKLITSLFKKEPHLKFFENKIHLLEVMKRFDIIVNLKNSTALYMPCMMKPCTFEEVRKQFIDESQSFYRTSWLCLDFQFLPPAFFNHILAWYIKQYSVSVITEKGTRNERKALYRQIGVFDLDSSGCEQLVVCEGPNVIAVQVWNSQICDKIYGNLKKTLCEFVDTLVNRYRLKITLTTSFKCKDGDFTINRQKIHMLHTKEYRCLEHKKNHQSEDLVKPWYVEEELCWMYESFEKTDED